MVKRKTLALTTLTHSMESFVRYCFPIPLPNRRLLDTRVLQSEAKFWQRTKLKLTQITWSYNNGATNYDRNVQREFALSKPDIFVFFSFMAF